MIAGLDNASRVAREEIFGPVLVVIPHDGDDDAVRIANDSPYGLSGSVDSGDLERAKAVAARIRTGTLAVNGGVWFAPDAPVRRLQAVRHRPRDGRGRLRGVPRDQARRRTCLTQASTPRKGTPWTSTTRSRSSPARRRASAPPTRRRSPTKGAAVVVADINEQAGADTAAKIVADGGKAIFVRCDVSSAESAEAMAAKAVEEFGGIDYLVNNAAIYGDMKFDLLISVDWEYYRKFMSVNMDGALVVTRAVYPHMAKRGGGSIVNQSSTAAYLYSGFYGLAKVGINGLTQQLAHELGGMNIRVNAIAPGPDRHRGHPHPGR